MTTLDSIWHDGAFRSYLLYEPASYNSSNPAPLVMNFHGFGSSAAGQMFYGDFRPIADTAGFLLVCPEGTLYNGQGHWNCGGAWHQGSTTDDIDFVDHLLDSLQTDYSIDSNRVYSTGMSNGGFFSYHLACNLSQRITAIASITGSMTPLTISSCNAQHITPVLQMSGTMDSLVPYNTSGWALGADSLMLFWNAINACAPQTVPINLPDLNILDNSTVDQFIFQGNANVANELFRINGGGHTWPGSVFNLPATNYDINACAEIWRFFSQYDKSALSFYPLATEFEGLDLAKLYPNPTIDNVTIHLKGEHQLRVFNFIGQVLYKLNFNNQVDISLKKFPAGIYLFEVDGLYYKILKN